MEKSILITNENNVTINGATKVISSLPNQILVQSDETIIYFSGEKLEVKKIDVDNKLVIISGIISGIKFNKKTENKSLLKRIFK